VGAQGNIINSVVQIITNLKEQFMSRFVLKALSAVLVVASVFGVATLWNAPAATPASSAEPFAATVKFEVAEDGNRFVFSSERLFDDGMPQYGTPFVTQGYLYPEGTLNGTNGVLANGEPEFPDQVMGEWTCYGYMIGDGGHTTTGEWVVSTQIYTFYGGEESTVVTNGFEIADFNLPVDRAITGGTGEYMGARGEQVQTLLGFTEQMGVNLIVELNIAE
jgi:hypothetical protein